MNQVFILFYWFCVKIFKDELSIDEINKLTKNLGKSLVNVLNWREPGKDLVCAESYCRNTSIQSVI